MNAFETAVVTAQQMRVIYGEAWRQFEAFWPAYLAKAEAKDKERNDQISSLNKIHEQRQKERNEFVQKAYQKLVFEYSVDLAVWQAEKRRWEKKFWFRGPCPIEPVEPRQPFFGPLFSPCWASSSDEADEARTLRNEVRDAHAAAFSGPTEFHLTQAQLQRMRDWESGAVLDTVRKYISEEKALA